MTNPEADRPLMPLQLPCGTIFPAIFGCVQTGGADTDIVENNETSYTMLPLLKGQLLVAACEESWAQQRALARLTWGSMTPVLGPPKLYQWIECSKDMQAQASGCNVRLCTFCPSPGSYGPPLSRLACWAVRPPRSCRSCPLQADIKRLETSLCCFPDVAAKYVRDVTR